MSTAGRRSYTLLPVRLRPFSTADLTAGNLTRFLQERREAWLYNVYTSFIKLCDVSQFLLQLLEGQGTG